MSDPQDTILAAGQVYMAQLASAKDSEPERDLLLALGPISVGLTGHQRAVRLCRLAVQRVLERRGWPTTGPIDDARHCLVLVDGWINGAPTPSLVEWARSCHVDDWCRGRPCREGEEEYTFALCEMLAALCRFTLYAGIWDGVEVLQSAPFAVSPYREDEFHTWLVNFALPAAIQ